MSSQQFCLKWNNHTSNMLNVFEHLLSTEALVDVTLACDGLSLKAHKMVLSACSPFFQSLFLENPCKHPIVILKDMSYKDLKAIIDFMYRGEVNVSQDQLSALLKTAETLKVKGLVEVSGENRQASGVVQQEISTPQSAPAQTMQQNQSSSRPDSPLQGKRKRGRPRRRSLSGSNRSDDESTPSKIKDLGSPEIEELSGDASMDGGGGDMLQSNSSQSQVHPSVNRISSSRHHHRSSRQMNAQVEELPSGDDNEFEVEPSKLLEQTLTTDNASNASSNMSSHFPSSSGIEISQIGLGDSQALVPSSAASDALSSTHIQGPDSPQDIKPAILTFDEPPVSPVAGPSHQSSDRSMMMYMDQSSMPGPSNYQDQALVQSDSQSQVLTFFRKSLPAAPVPNPVKIGATNKVVMPFPWPANAKLFLVKGNWPAPKVTLAPQNQPATTKAVSNPKLEETDVTSIQQPNGDEHIIPDDIEMALKSDVKLEIPDDEDDDDDYLDSVASEGRVTEDSPLPEFSESVKKNIENNNINPVWHAFMEESATHYYNLYPNMHSSSEYQMIGKKMFSKYPVIEYEGKEPWSFFCRCLSQKIRHKKWKAKRKSSSSKKIPRKSRKIAKRRSTIKKIRKVEIPDEVKEEEEDKEEEKEDVEPPKLISILNIRTERGVGTNKLHRALLLELTDGWKTNSISELRIKEILKETFKNRENYLKDISCRRLMYLVEQFPCFTCGRYVVHELLMKLKETDTSRLKKRCDKFFSALRRIRSSDENYGPSKQPYSSPSDIESLIKYTEECVGYQRPMRFNPSTLVSVKKDVQDSDIADLLQAKKDAYPHLLIFCEGELYKESYVVGDKTVINAEAADVYDGLITLLAVYYSFGFDYPKTYVQILGLLQTFILGDTYQGSKNSKCTSLISKLNEEFEKSCTSDDGDYQLL